MNEDQAYQELTKYSAEVGKYLQEELSEADTRAKFVDVFLKVVLHWREEDIRRERTYWNEDKRAALDYEVGVGKPLFVVEAKRHRQDFELPNPERYQLLYQLDGLVQSRPNLWAAIEQARKYCDDTGIPYGLVTNGRQFGLFKAIVVGQSWRTGSVAVFDIETLQRRCFVEVAACLHAAASNPHAMDQLLRAGPSLLEAQRVADSVGPQVGRLSNKMTDVWSKRSRLFCGTNQTPTGSSSKNATLLTRRRSTTRSLLKAFCRTPSHHSLPPLEVSALDTRRTPSSRQWRRMLQERASVPPSF